jgi:putative glutamine amidotransferase
MKFIGVSACFIYPDPTRLTHGHKTLQYFERDMSRYLSRKGVMPILIPDLDNAEQFQDFISQMDGFVFQGGADLAPQSYGEEPILDGRWKGDAYRDAYELKIMDYAVKAGKPVLAICRGFQLMNVYFGGTLYQDLITQNPQVRKHRDAELYDKISHGVNFTPGGLFEHLYGNYSSKKVNTVHHQGVKDLGKDLKVQATSTEDGIVEAFTWNGAEEGKVMGVQWHPEFFHTIKEQLIPAEPVYDQFLKFV